MARRKLGKFKQKWKNKKEDKSKIISRVDEGSVGVKCEEFSPESCVSEPELQDQKCSKSTGLREKCSKQVHFTVLPDRYEPLEEDRASDRATEKSHRDKHKRFRKNFGKALRYTWKCLVVGLQTFSTSYSGPMSAASTLVTEIQRTSPKA